MDSLTGSLTSNSLASKSDIYEFTNKTSTTVLDAFFTNWITRISTEFETACDRRLFKQSLFGYYNGDNSNVLLVRNYPIQNISSVNIRSSVNHTWVDITNDIDESYLNSYKITAKTNVFPIGNATVKLEYTAGYNSIPEDLKGRTIQEVVLIFKKSALGDERIGAQSKTIPDTPGGTITFDTKEFLERNQDIINKYKSIEL